MKWGIEKAVHNMFGDKGKDQYKDKANSNPAKTSLAKKKYFP